MTVSTDAILFYGFQIPTYHEETLPWVRANMQFDTNTWIAENIFEHHKPKQLDSMHPDQRQEFWDKRYELLDNYPIRIGYSCTSSEPHWYIYIKTQHRVCARGDTINITRSLPFDEKWLEMLQEFAQKCNFPPVVMDLDEKKYYRAGWWLTVYAEI